MKEKLSILAIQMQSMIGDVETNIHKVESLVARNIRPETDLIILPEVWTVGWSPRAFEATAQGTDGSVIKFLSDLAKRYNVFIIGGSFINRRGTKIFNTSPVINPQGELIATYDKMHLFSYYGCDEGTFVEKGANPVIVNIKGFKIGISICYDIRFPEIYRAYRKAGADVLIDMAAWPESRSIHWEMLTRARAVENQTFFVALTQSGHIEGSEYNLGHSRIIDYSGNVLSEITEGEGGMCAEIELSEMYDFRQKCRVLEDIQEKYEVKVL